MHLCIFVGIFCYQNLSCRQLQHVFILNISMYENNENELEIYFTPEDLILHSSPRNTNSYNNLALTKMEQNLRPNYLPHGSKTDDHDRTHGRVDSWYNLDGGLELEDISPVPRPDINDVPFQNPQQDLDSNDKDILMPKKLSKPKSGKKKSKIVCCSICFCIILGVSVPLGIFFGPELISIIQGAITGVETSGIKLLSKFKLNSDKSISLHTINKILLCLINSFLEGNETTSNYTTPFVENTTKDMTDLVTEKIDPAQITTTKSTAATTTTTETTTPKPGK